MFTNFNYFYLYNAQFDLYFLIYNSDILDYRKLTYGERYGNIARKYKYTKQ